MSELPQPADPGRLRVADADRDQTAAALQRAAAEGRLSIDELDERVRLAYSAKTYADLQALTRDLPGQGATAPLAPGSGVPLAPADARVGTFSVAVMSGSQRAGEWVVPPTYTAVAIMGGIDLDLRHARLTGAEVTIQAFCLMGGVRVIVGEDAAVDVSGFGLMGAFDHEATGPGRPGGPRVRVTGFALMGGVEVRRGAAGAPLPD